MDTDSNEDIFDQLETKGATDGEAPASGMTPEELTDLGAHIDALRVAAGDEVDEDDEEKPVDTPEQEAEFERLEEQSVAEYDHEKRHGVGSAGLGDDEEGEDESIEPPTAEEIEADKRELAERMVKFEREKALEQPHNPTPNAALLATLKESVDGSMLDVAMVPEAEACTSDEAKKPDYDKMIAAMRKAMGPAADAISDEVLLRGCQARVVHPGKKQRKAPLFATPTAREVELWRDGRPALTGLTAGDKENGLDFDAAKGVRNDGGSLGPVRKYARICEQEGVDAAVANAIGEKIAEVVQHRISEIRCIVVMTLNQIRREVAVMKGKNPASIRYIKVGG